jgi:hypothetical protein
MCLDTPVIFMTSTHPKTEYPEYDPTDPDSLDEYYESTKLEARFDPLTIQSLVVEAIPKHAAYEMMFDEYIKQRSQLMNRDDSEHKRLSFYLPLFPAMLSADFATEYKLSYHRFLIFAIELGLIMFKYDYNEEYKLSKQGKRELSKTVTTSTRKLHYLQMDKQKICVGSCDNQRHGASKHFTPNVPEWLYNAISDCAAYLNMSITDFSYLCWCIGTTRTIPNDIMNPLLDRENSVIIQSFETELSIYTDRIRAIQIHINSCQ